VFFRYNFISFTKKVFNLKAPTNLPIFSNYEFDSRFYDEIFTNNNEVRKVYETLFNLFNEYSVEDFANLNNKAKDAFFNHTTQ